MTRGSSERNSTRFFSSSRAWTYRWRSISTGGLRVAKSTLRSSKRAFMNPVTPTSGVPENRPQSTKSKSAYTCQRNAWCGSTSIRRTCAQTISAMDQIGIRDACLWALGLRDSTLWGRITVAFVCFIGARDDLLDRASLVIWRFIRP